MLWLVGRPRPVSWLSHRESGLRVQSVQRIGVALQQLVLPNYGQVSIAAVFWH